MSKATRGFFENLKKGLHEALPGLSNIVPDLASELKRLGVQGQMELASAIYSGSSFVPYGPGQYTPSERTDASKDAGKVIEEPQKEQSRGIEM